MNEKNLNKKTESYSSSNIVVTLKSLLTALCILKIWPEKVKIDFWGPKGQEQINIVSSLHILKTDNKNNNTTSSLSLDALPCPFLPNS